jgi:hypothetical protein
MSLNVPPPLPQDPGKTLVAPSTELEDVLEAGALHVSPGMEAPATRSMFRRGLEVFAENKPTCWTPTSRRARSTCSAPTRTASTYSAG